MFDLNNQDIFITSGASEVINNYIANTLLSLINDLVTEVDYLQTFSITRKGDALEIIHKQENPEYCETVIAELSDKVKEEYCKVEEGEAIRIWCIDDGINITILLPDEY